MAITPTCAPVAQGVRSSSKPSLVPARPLRPRSVAWWSSLVANFNNTVLGQAFVVEAKARRVGASSRCGSGSPQSHKPLPRGDDNLGVQLHLALQQLCVELLHQFLYDLAFLGLKAHEAQVKFAFLLFGRIGQGLHSPVDHLAHVLGHHCGPLGLLHKRSLGYDSRGRLMLH